jgi:hypothetical protein
MRSRSNSARAAKTWNTSLPPGVVVSIASCRLRNPIFAVGQAGDGVDQMPQGPAQSVELPDDQSVARVELVQDLIEGGAVGAGAASRLGEHATAASLSAGVDLEAWLLVGGGDAGVAEQMAHA